MNRNIQDVLVTFKKNFSIYHRRIRNQKLLTQCFVKHKKMKVIKYNDRPLDGAELGR